MTSSRKNSILVQDVVRHGDHREVTSNNHLFEESSADYGDFEEQERALAKVPSPFMNIGKVDQINYY